MDQLELFHQKSVWMHYIGGYYDSVELFIREAKQHGISRRIPLQSAPGMHFGDRVILLRYHNKITVSAFGEMEIHSIIFDVAISHAVGQRLAQDGKAQYIEGGASVNRECGSYIITGTWIVTVDIPDIIKLALEISESQQIKNTFAMIGGPLTMVYKSPVYLDPAPKFCRGFIRANQEATFEFPDGVQSKDDHTIVAIQSYAKRDNPKRPSTSSRRHYTTQQAGLL
jgi:hypothetical protein